MWIGNHSRANNELVGVHNSCSFMSRGDHSDGCSTAAPVRLVVGFDMGFTEHSATENAVNFPVRRC